MRVAAFRRSTPAADELSARLTAAGLRPSGRRRGEGAATAGFAASLAQALASGPAVDAAFARWLATRVHLLAPEDCRALARVPEPFPEPGAVATPEALERVLGEELPAFAAVLAAVDPAPVAVSPFRIRYGARHADGRRLEVVVTREGSARHLEADRWGALVRVLDHAGLPGGELLADFRRAGRHALDLPAEADLLAELAADAASFPQLVVPSVLVADGRRCVTSRVLVRQAQDGGEQAGDGNEAAAPEVAWPRASYVWLRQVVLGRAFPLHPAGRGVRWLHDGRIAWVEGPFTSLPAASQAQIWAYLEAVLDHDQERACEALLPELTADAGGVADTAELRLRLRQLATLREGSLGDGADPLVDELLAALRVARECSFRPRRPLADLAASAFHLADGALEASAGTDPVLRALGELRLERRAAELRGAWTPAALGALPAETVRALLELPGKLDTALDLLSRGEARVRIEEPPVPEAGRRGWVPAIAVLVTVLLLVVPRLGDLWAAGIDPGQAVALAAAVLAATWLGGRMGRW